MSAVFRYMYFFYSIDNVISKGLILMPEEEWKCQNENFEYSYKYSRTILPSFLLSLSLSLSYFNSLIPAVAPSHVLTL